MSRKAKRSDGDFYEEIQSHIQIEEDRLVGEGMSRREASAAARRAFGNVAGSQERLYESSRWMWLDRFAKDVKYALRQMKDSPVSTATVVLSLAVGIGVSTAVFSLADQALLRALPVKAPEQLVQLDWNGLFVGAGMGSVGYGSLVPYLLYRDLRQQNEVFADMFASSPQEVHLAVGKEPEAVSAEIVTGSYFLTLGVHAALGRLLGDEDDLKPGAHPVIVLSFEYWRSRLGADPNIVGRQIRLNNFPMTVVGVAEQGFHGMDWSVAPALWVPMMMKTVVTPDWNGLEERRARFLHVFARLRLGVGRQQAQARLQPWFKAYLRADTQRQGWPPVTETQMHEYMASNLDLLPGAQGQSLMRSHMERPIEILLAATGLILLLACLNVANLSLARVLARRRATAMRAALGASRARILGEQLVESALLALAGCAFGALLAPSLIRGIVSFLPQSGAAGIALSAELDLRMLWFGLGVTALATLLSGMAPALYAASVDPIGALKQQSSAVAGAMGLRKALVIGQFALAFVLLVGAGLFARTLGTLRAQGTGFPITNLLMLRLSPLGDGYDAAKSKLLFRRLLTSLQALPEVERAGIGRWELLRGGGWNNPVTVVAHRRTVTPDSIPMNAVSPDFFDTLGAPVIRGRAFTDRDSTDSLKWRLRSAIVNEEFVKRYVQNADPIGARVGIGGGPATVADMEIVGVVRNFHDQILRAPEPQIYFPLWERSVEEGTVYVRTRTSSETATHSIRAAVSHIDPALPVLAMRTLDDQLDRMLTFERMLSTLSGVFAGMATFLALIGLYGVLSFSAASRSKEIGIRLALGAPRWAAGGLIVREAALLAAVGLAIALPASWAMGRLIESQLFGVRPMDALTMTGAAVILVLVCLGASAAPARRAGLADLSETLRGQ